MRRWLTWLIVLLPFAAMAQVQQTGRVTPGHPVMWTTDGVIQDAGTSSQGGLTTLGLTSPNLQSTCINNGPTTGPYNSLCLGINGSQAQITVSSFGGAPTIPFYCVVNGVSSPCAGGAGSYLPLSGGTLSGNLTISLGGLTVSAGGENLTGGLIADTAAFSAAGTALNVTHNASIGGTLTVSGLLLTSVNPSVTAAGSNQSTATILTSTTNVVTTVGSGTGVEVPQGQVFVANRGANALLVYPPSGAQIETFGTNNPVTLLIGSNTQIVCASTQCRVIQ